MILRRKRRAAACPLLGVLFLACAAPAFPQDGIAGQIRTAQSSANYPEAARLYSQLIAQGSDSPELRSNYGLMLHLSGKNREAMEQFHIALNRNPALSAANLFGGLTEFDLGSYQSALKYLKEARRLDPDHPAPLLALGKTYVALRDFGLANECYTKAAALDGTAAEAWYGVGVTDRSLAEELLNHAARTGKAADPATRDKAQKLLDQALSALTRAVELAPDSARTHLIMAESLSDSGKFAQAIPEYQTAIKLDETLSAAYLGLATEYWKQSQFDQALPLLERVLGQSPKDPEANGIMADIQQHKGNNAGAERYAGIALAGNPDLIETRLVLARVYLAKQQPKRAIAELQKVLAADPDGAYHFLLYRAYKQAGDEPAARATMAEFQQIRYGK